jgi:hypothetical protein
MDRDTEEAFGTQMGRRYKARSALTERVRNRFLTLLEA